MTVRLWLVLILLTAVLLHGTTADAATPAQVAAAIEKGKAFLYSKQNNDNWEFTDKRNQTGAGYDESAGQWGGVTSVVTYALIAGGDDPREGRLKAAIEWLKRAKIVGVYALGCRCQVWLVLPQTEEIRKLSRNDAHDLLDGMITSGRGKYLYDYTVNKKDNNAIDHSVSQFGVLGLWACEQINREIVPTAYWRDVDERWSKDQQNDGGWFYHGEAFDAGDHMHTSTQASMTAAGVATLYITQDYVRPEQYTRCAGNISNPHIEAGVKFLAEHQSLWTPDAVFGTPVSEWYPSYTLYGIQRIGVAGGLKYIGNIDWFQYGADWLIAHQSADGAWRGPADVDNTALSILFLARGQAPVLVNKVRYDNASGPDNGKPGRWNQRPRDVANFVRWVGRQNERDLSWQITNLDTPESQLHDAPFLYFSGDKPLLLSADQKNKLRQYCQEGGMILFNADCGGGTGSEIAPFVKSVQKLGSELFPSYEFRDLPPDHPIYSEVFNRKKWKQPPTIKGLSNGVREMLILLPDDPARAWQLQQTNGTGKEEAYQSIDDILLYGTDKQPLPVKGTPFLVTPDPAIRTDRKVLVGRIKYTGNWDPEPGGWTRLSAVMHNRCKVQLDAAPVPAAGPFPPEMKILHMTGTGRFSLPEADVASLKKFLDTGGTLLIDAAGGSSDFADAAETLVHALSPGTAPALVPPDDPVFKLFDPKLDVKYRAFARTVIGNLKGPQLRAVSVNNRTAIYYSRQDLSAGLVGETVDGIYGYDPPTATAITAGVLLRASPR